MGFCVDYMTIKRMKTAYQEANIAYNMQQNHAELVAQFGENFSYSDEQVMEVYRKQATAPVLLGGLVDKFGLTDKPLDLELWRDLSHGYIKKDYLPMDSHLHYMAQETPRGEMVALNQRSSIINEKGEYEVAKNNNSNASLEFVLSESPNLTNALIKRQEKYPDTITQYREMALRTIERYVLPIIQDKGIIRTGEGGKNIEQAAEILAAMFLHLENRAEDPFLHVHLNIENVAMSKSGNVGALTTRSITKLKSQITYAWQQGMRMEIEQGFGLKVDKPVFSKKDEMNAYLTDSQKHIVAYDIADDFVPDFVRKHYTTRQKEISQDTGGNSGFIAREIAQSSSRDQKTEKTPSQLITKWHQETNSMGWKVEDLMDKIEFMKTQPRYEIKHTDEELIGSFSRNHFDNYVMDNGPTYQKINPTIPNVKMTPLSAMMLNIAEKEGVTNDDEIIENVLRQIGDVAFTESQFKGSIQLQLLSEMTPYEAEKKAEQLFNDQCLQVLKVNDTYFNDFIMDRIQDPDKYREMQIRYSDALLFTTRYQRDTEKYNIESIKARENETHFQFDKDEVLRFIEDFENGKTASIKEKMGDDFDPSKNSFKFKPGQHQAIVETLTEKGAYINIQGLAGAGKSTLLECATEFMKTKGYKVYGLSTGSAATDNLAESTNLKEGEFNSIASTLIKLKEGKLVFDNKTLIIGDEMGMCNTDDYNKILRYMNGDLGTGGGAKLVAVGDKDQVQNIGWGNPYRVMTEEFRTVVVSEINRQKESWQREMVHNFAYGQSDHAMQSLYENNKIKIYDTDEQAIKGMAKSIVDANYKDTEKLGMSISHHFGNKINYEIREEKKARGQLSNNPKEGLTMTCINTYSGEEVKREFAKNDRIIFTKNQEDNSLDPVKLKNSQRGTVVGFRFNRLTKENDAMKIKMDNGKEVWINKDSKPDMSYGYVSTVHSSQGQTKDLGEFFATDGITLHTAYVALSRQREDVKIHVSRQQLDLMATRAADSAPTAEMQDKVKAIATIMHNGKFDEEILKSFKDCRTYINTNCDAAKKHNIELPFKQYELDDLRHCIDQMATTSYKKTLKDYQIIEGEATKKYHEAMEYRRSVRLNPETEYDISKLVPNKVQIKSEIEAKKQMQSYQAYEGAQLVSHGFAPYKNEVGAKQSYYVETDKGTTWGINLKDSIAESGAKAGDYIKIERLSKESVIVEDKNNQFIQANRQNWKVEVVEPPKHKPEVKQSSKSDGVEAETENAKQKTKAKIKI